jgi:uncharacterized LabA/DUF88 family protein
LKRRGELLRAFYYTTIVEDQEYSPIRPLVDWLDYNGFAVVTKATKEYADTNGRRKIKGSMSIELVVDAMEAARHVGQVMLFTGDADFRPLVAAIQGRGVHVTVVSTLLSQPPMVANELRRQADLFIDLAELQSRIARDAPHLRAPRLSESCVATEAEQLVPTTRAPRSMPCEFVRERKQENTP